MSEKISLDSSDHSSLFRHAELTGLGDKELAPYPIR